MILKIWKKSKLNSEMIWKIWQKGKLNRYKIWTIWTKGELKVKRYGKYRRKVS